MDKGQIQIGYLIGGAALIVTILGGVMSHVSTDSKTENRVNTIEGVIEDIKVANIQTALTLEAINKNLTQINTTLKIKKISL